MPTGTVKFFDAMRGFGFITPEDQSQDVYVHRSPLQGEGFRYLVSGEPVAFETRWDDQRQQSAASRVTAPTGREVGTIVQFDDHKVFGVIEASAGQSRVFVHYKQVLGEGRQVPEPQAFRVKRMDPRPPFLRFAFLGSEDAWLEPLASLGEPENWSHSGVGDPVSEQAPRRPILRSYIFHTFAKLEAEGKVVVGQADGRGYS